ncbi:three component ABC system middle component [Stenoxybacter acetivorans]|uniref:three component ABC system middle component n=1 Tax=Stenoxybacter acetivorans TaxID=422441 RepID=UPI0024812C89|nr:three component ABC system middle component [Stenoxybacter acetivorans]
MCAAILADFCHAYRKNSAHGPNLLLTYIALPVTFSDDLAATFEKTNERTGFLEWLDRNPIILSGLSRRINGTLWITSQAIQYGCLYKLLQLNNDGSLCSATNILPTKIKRMEDGTANPVFRRARLFGSWCAQMGSPRAIIEALGVSV